MNYARVGIVLLKERNDLVVVVLREMAYRDDSHALNSQPKGICWHMHFDWIRTRENK
ncbi:16214_t:CDS:2 [Cetraspora pellucida]|uniref:16214_t:CDS:1 n=1 Tax=Cetraspora pellucida TaxID=1433469 RepID=A0ACA9K045_9GLOM|nr:16214_t:CDS:2 [Cetraspora pellucida]